MLQALPVLPALPSLHLLRELTVQPALPVQYELPVPPCVQLVQIYPRTCARPDDVPATTHTPTATVLTVR